MRSSAAATVLFVSLLAWHASAQQLPATGPFSQASIAKALQGPQSENRAVLREPLSGTPAVIHREYPFYPADAMRHRIQGAVVEAEVKTDGTVGDVKVLRSLDKTYGLDDAAVKAAKRWRFKPVIKDGKAVPVTVTIEMAFNLADSIVSSKRD